MATKIIGSQIRTDTALNINVETATTALSCTGNAATATTASSCTGNAATATVASSCTGNAATATTASSCTGNAATATSLETARNINGVSFDGSEDITVADSTKMPLAGGAFTGSVSGTGTWLDSLQSLGSLASATTINFSNGSYAKFSVGDSFVLSFTAGGTCRMGALEFTYDESDHDITWNGVEWSGGSAPEFDTEGGVNIVTLVTSDGGTTWYGMLSGKAFA